MGPPNKPGAKSYAGTAHSLLTHTHLLCLGVLAEGSFLKLLAH